MLPYGFNTGLDSVQDRNAAALFDVVVYKAFESGSTQLAV